jgi:hypothetical protein
VWTGSQLLEWGQLYDPTTLKSGDRPVYRDTGISFGP